MSINNQSQSSNSEGMVMVCGVHLRVEDAVSYLEQVKERYNQRPEIYNNFLEIMKEFKAQSIDTPVVIDRVAHLFQGDPEMITGFNMFLPPEYRVEVHYTNEPFGVTTPNYAGLDRCRGGGATYTVSTIHTPSRAGLLGVGAGPNGVDFQVPLVGDHIFKHPSVLPLPLPNMNMDIRHGLRFSSPSKYPPLGHRSPYPIGYGNMFHMHMQEAHTTVPNITRWSTPNGKVSADNGNLAVTMRTAISVSAAENGLKDLSFSRESLAMSCYSTSPGPPLMSSSPVMNAEELATDFNFAYSYVNRVKTAFEAIPGKYQEFLGLIAAYQNYKASQSQLPSPNPSGGVVAKNPDKLFKQVKKFFKGRSDLLGEFRLFISELIPAQSPSQSKAGKSKGTKSVLPPKKEKQSSDEKQNPEQPKKRAYKRKQANPKYIPNSLVSDPSQTSQVSSSCSSISPAPKPIECIPKRHVLPRGPEIPVTTTVSSSSSSKTTGNVSEHEVDEGTMTERKGRKKKMSEDEFFEKVRNFLNPLSEAYDNFLLIITYFSKQTIPGPDCLQLVTPILAPAPELLHWFRKYIRRWEKVTPLPVTPNPIVLDTGINQTDTEESIVDIDYSTCRRHATSYCIVPNKIQSGSQGSFVDPTDPICVLNDVYVSIPHGSENIRYTAPRRTQLEICQNRVEDDRFELDMVIESNLQTIECFQEIERKMSRMGPVERENFTLDEYLGGTSSFLNEHSVRRLYGDEEKGDDIIEGLKKCPATAIPIVLRRLKAKDEEWCEIRKEYQNYWRDELDLLQSKASEQKNNKK